MTLSATRAKALQEPGRYSDGGGLPLYIGKAGRKSWVLRITVDGRRRDIGLGGYPSASLALACKKARIPGPCPLRRVVTMLSKSTRLRRRPSRKPPIPSI